MSFDTHSLTSAPGGGDPVIEVENLAKCYRIYDRPRDRLVQMLPFVHRPRFREFWALHEVGFAVRAGETMGIIGRNGSGKSTLLQLICGTLNPTLGQVRLRGKVAALLELGAGFNPEFTGRENVLMSASLYGLTLEQVKDRFDRIAAFADIGDHLDQPVKNYSSGMYVRLAFAVIAHVDADILVIDEALAVGDAIFTQKCMRFIRQFRERGTLLFVSHDMGSVLNLCEQALWLHEGRLRRLGSAKNIAEEYLQFTLQTVYGDEVALNKLEGKGNALSGTPDHESRREGPIVEKAVAPAVSDFSGSLVATDNLAYAKGWKTGAGEIVAVTIHNLAEPYSTVFRGGETLCLRIRAIAHTDLARPILGFLVLDRLGQQLFGENTLPFTQLNPLPVATGTTFEAEYVFKLPLLPNGQYTVTASLADGELYNHVQHHWLYDALVLSVSSSKVRWGLVGLPFEKVSLRKLS